MLARAARCRDAFPHRFVAPAEAAEMMRVGATLCDVRTEQQVLDHEVGGAPGRVAVDSRRLALDNMVIAGGPPPMPGGLGRKVVAVCPAGPKPAIPVRFPPEFGLDAYSVRGRLPGCPAAGLSVPRLPDAHDPVHSDL